MRMIPVRTVLQNWWRRLQGAPEAAPHAGGGSRQPAAGGPWQPGHVQAGMLAGDYRLYLPASAGPGPWPLLVMLHGCKQDPDDFARGTDMNAQAEAQGWAVLYPQQSRRRNLHLCWNWFLRANQRRGHGEPALIVAMVQQVVQQHAIDPARICVAGLSAGGAMAALVSQLYPELFAGVGVFAGMAPCAARHTSGALQAMQRGSPGVSLLPRGWLPAPLIVFQGDADTVVHPLNAQYVLEACAPPAARVESSTGELQQRRVTCRRLLAADGQVQAESWTVHGGGHAWCGGHPAGSYTDPLGPDASREMLRFFAAHGRHRPTAAAGSR